MPPDQPQPVVDLSAKAVFDAILGPLGALVLALVVLWVLLKVIAALWRDHQRADQDDRDQRDAAFAVAHAQVEATNRVADSSADIDKQTVAIASAITALAQEVAAVRRDMAARRRERDG